MFTKKGATKEELTIFMKRIDMHIGIYSTVNISWKSTAPELSSYERTGRR